MKLSKRKRNPCKFYKHRKGKIKVVCTCPVDKDCPRTCGGIPGAIGGYVVKSIPVVCATKKAAEKYVAEHPGCWIDSWNEPAFRRN